MSKDDFDVLANKIRAIYAEVVGDDFRTEILTHTVLKERMEETNSGKHAKQQSSMLGHMDRLALLQKKKVFAEFGCGKGDLSNYVHAAVGDPSKFLLVDRRNFRKKFDSALRFTDNWQRLQMDIKDLNLTMHPTANGSHLIAYSKHLCGAATDLTLRCLGNFVKSSENHLEGVVIALCCHQICKHDIYINPEYLNEVGIGGEEFPLLCVISTWATCGRRKPEADEQTTAGKATPATEQKRGLFADSDEEREKVDEPPAKKQKTEGLPADSDEGANEASEAAAEKEEKEDEDRADEEGEPDHTTSGFDDTDQQEGDHWSGLAFEERETLGFQVKRIIDMGRARYLESLGMKVDLVYYVDRATSLENLLLLASR
ncbi:tRNA:m(4)X modification enzyme TRM13 [Rhizophlyctis rosea]|uniref:tRNA:m(4)X modification enzyme TRM13 n=1 Tax=Rhizophlyctis rosea TaxID=64517 RepID=A0AAD5SC52_9FUNG|nr:tRNA:m(4)X modification enzyme TRM13 [Rhizophlyctis rosea]